MKIILLGLLIANLLSCRAITGTDTPSAINGYSDRRLYVNDAAKNDSLKHSIIDYGIRLVLQPNITYNLSLIGSKQNSDQLTLYTLDNGGTEEYVKPSPVTDGTKQFFEFTSHQSAAQFFVAKVTPQNRSLLLNDLTKVTLTALPAVNKDTLFIDLLFINQLTGLTSNAQKQIYAEQFFKTLNGIYSQFVTPTLPSLYIQGDIDIVQPTSKPFVYAFSTNEYIPLPGTRRAKHVHIYIVDNISYAGNTGGAILGFTGREAFDIDTHRESRIILSNQGGDVYRLAATAAHEMGHFFGLRHTVATNLDLGQEDDDSNLDDGFTDTKLCALDIAIASAKISAQSKASITTKNSPPKIGNYCLRRAGNDCNALCDLGNLMHAYECQSLVQKELSKQQILFLRTNISLYSH